jgi:integrase
LLDACEVLGGYGAEFRAAIQFAAWTGIRAGELHAVQWDDVTSKEAARDRLLAAFRLGSIETGS